MVKYIPETFKKLDKCFKPNIISLTYSFIYIPIDDCKHGASELMKKPQKHKARNYQHKNLVITLNSNNFALVYGK